ncbi:hypothetical protein SAMN00120144_0645 [Hymenobacter roseosalivarius DSM 11622]|uniref:Uncharacterized protein n=1 Tax=Hymenobacter roseosalivarius DSM 11622 TaxID=645990 RepID=A0A1W1VCQ8_9BACT|nr:hypothetical protein SAMN00120144_0645 [Hymenobacter roseosalivarius DSM 11622]
MFLKTLQATRSRSVNSVSGRCASYRATTLFRAKKEAAMALPWLSANLVIVLFTYYSLIGSWPKNMLLLKNCDELKSYKNICTGCGVAV